MNLAQIKYFLYARKSTEAEDRQMLSIEAQIAELKELATRDGISIIEELVEKQSAKAPGRPIFNQMLDRVEKGEANGILAWHPDRLARNSVDGGRIIYLLDTGHLAALKFSTFWFEPTPQGKFMLSIAFGQSKYYVDSLSENTRRGLRQKVRRGEYPGIAPLGYMNDVRNKLVIPDKKEAAVVKEMFSAYATNKYRLEDMSNFLAQKGIKSRNGRLIHKGRVKYILTNPFYYGHFIYSGEVYPGKHLPLISKKLFDQVQQVLKLRSRLRKRSQPQVLTRLV